MDGNLPRSVVQGIFQAKILEWAAISFSRGSSQARDRTWVSCIADRCFTVWAPREASHLYFILYYILNYSHTILHTILQSYVLCRWSFPGKNIGVGSLSLFQGIFPTQGSNLGLPHCRQILYCLSHQGNSIFWVNHTFFLQNMSRKVLR